MASPFTPLAQRHDDASAKTVAALERLARVISHTRWRSARLPPLQGALLGELAARPAQVRELAIALRVSRPTVSRALAQLVRQGLAFSAPDPHDRRQRLFTLTPAGRQLHRQATEWAAPILSAVQDLPAPHQEHLLLALLHVIAVLVKTGHLGLTGLCLTCAYLRWPSRQRPGYYCQLLDQALPVRQLRLECPDHRPAVGG